MYEIEIKEPNNYLTVNGKISRTPFKAKISENQLNILKTKLRSLGITNYIVIDLDKKNKNEIIIKTKDIEKNIENVNKLDVKLEEKNKDYNFLKTKPKEKTITVDNILLMKKTEERNIEIVNNIENNLEQKNDVILEDIIYEESSVNPIKNFDCEIKIEELFDRSNEIIKDLLIVDERT